MSNSPHRLTQIDALRGLAAMAVVLFHYTAAFQRNFDVAQRPLIEFPLGYYGVKLFFIISGFVIFMTLQRSVRPMDFVISRFSRLYPAYWCAVVLTFSLTHWLGLPGTLRSVPEAAANLLMFHSLFGIASVDGVYWTLEVELLFYVAAFVLARLGLLSRIHLYLWAMLALRLAYFAAQQGLGVHLPSWPYRLLILEHLPWFAMGIAVYQAVGAGRGRAIGIPLLTLALAAGSLAVTDAALALGLALLFSALVWAAAQGRIRLLEGRGLVWLGAISYPLYLLHQNIGWSLLLQALKSGLGINTAILLVCAASLLMAYGLHLLVEAPAMRWIRRRYRARHP